MTTIAAMKHFCEICDDKDRRGEMRSPRNGSESDWNTIPLQNDTFGRAN